MGATWYAAGAAAAAAWTLVAGVGGGGDGVETYHDPAALKGVVDEFLRHLRTKDDPRARRAVAAYKGFRADPSMPGVMSFSRSTGILKVNPDRVRDDPAHALSTLLHELAHSTPARHDENWRDAFVYFLRLATEELGWRVALACPHCKHYGVCAASDCPRCTFEACKPGDPRWSLRGCRSKHTCVEDTGTPAPR